MARPLVRAGVGKRKSFPPGISALRDWNSPPSSLGKNGGPDGKENPWWILETTGISLLASSPGFQKQAASPSNWPLGPVRGKAFPPCARGLQKIAAPSRTGRPPTPTVRPPVGPRQQHGAYRPRGIKAQIAQPDCSYPPGRQAPQPGYSPERRGLRCPPLCWLARTGNIYLRYSRIEAANSVRRHDATYVADSARKVGEGTQRAHRWTLVLTARQWPRWAFALPRDDRAYDPTHRSGIPGLIANCLPSAMGGGEVRIREASAPLVRLKNPPRQRRPRPPAGIGRRRQPPPPQPPQAKSPKHWPRPRRGFRVVRMRRLGGYGRQESATVPVAGIQRVGGAGMAHTTSHPGRHRPENGDCQACHRRAAGHRSQNRYWQKSHMGTQP